MTILGRLIPWWVGPLAGAAIVAGLWFWHAGQVSAAYDEGHDQGVLEQKIATQSATELLNAALREKSAEAYDREREADAARDALNETLRRLARERANDTDTRPGLAPGRLRRIYSVGP